MRSVHLVTKTTIKLPSYIKRTGTSINALPQLKRNNRYSRKAAVADDLISIGIDQGIANCGYAIVGESDRYSYHVYDSGTIETTTEFFLEQRVGIVYEEIKRVVERAFDISKNVVISCEELFFNPQTTERRNKSASIVYANMTTGLIYLLADEFDMKVEQYVPGTVKKAVAGHGRASKEKLEGHIIELTGRRLGFGTDHESDAVGIGITRLIKEKNK